MLSDYDLIPRNYVVCRDSNGNGIKKVLKIVIKKELWGSQKGTWDLFSPPPNPNSGPKTNVL